MRRMFSMLGTVFLLRCVSMLITSLSVPGHHLQCQNKVSKNPKCLSIHVNPDQTVDSVSCCCCIVVLGPW